MRKAIPSQGRTSGTDDPGPPPHVQAERDLLGLAIVVVALLLFVSTGSAVLTEIVRNRLYGLGKPDMLLGNALILNIALLIYGWRRHAEMAREIAARRASEQTAKHLANTDALTGCLNRRSLDQAMAALVTSAAATGDAAVVMMIDLDKFKLSNDLHGHLVGDAVLVETAKRIAGLLPERSVVARLGGDEFTCGTVFAPGSESAIERLAVRINDALANPVVCNGAHAKVTASIGIAICTPRCGPDGAPCAQDLLHRADLAMYHAKKSGRNRFSWFEQSMEEELRLRSELERSIRDGIARGEFVPYYEKQIDLETGALTGFEMLARWQSPRRGLISPDIFIPVAEEIGVIAEMSEHLIAQALRDAKAWPANLTLSVNISPVQLRDPWFAQKLLKLLVEASFPASRLEIEITETCLHENIGMVRALITSLQNQGITVTLDDFGTGYSSVAQLRALPFDRIKIDRSFIATIGSSADSQTIVEAITSLGRGMALPITAEGIETPEVLAALRKLGAFKGQGYMYGKPATFEQVCADLASQGLLSAHAASAPEPVTPAPQSPAAANG